MIRRLILKNLMLLCGLWLPVLVKAQLMLSPQVPPTGLIKKEQLWNLVLINNGEGVIDVQIQVSMLDIKTGRKVLTGSSRLLAVAKGSRLLQASDMMPVQYAYYDEAAVVDRSVNGLLPVGSYQLCYTPVLQSGSKVLPMPDECAPAEVLPLSPPQLNAPADRDTVKTIHPMFQWLPPAPLNMFSDLNYDFVLVELRKGQHANEAVQKNPPVCMQGLLKTIFFNYPSSAKSLEEGKTYAWQITARNGSSYAQKTEAWAFTVNQAAQLVALKANGFTRLLPGTAAQYYVFEDQLKFAYINNDNDSTTIARFYKEEPGKALVYQKLVNIKPGENLISEDILTKSIFHKNEIYRLEITDKKGITWALLFMYKPAEQ